MKWSDPPLLSVFPGVSADYLFPRLFKSSGDLGTPLPREFSLQLGCPPSSNSSYLSACPPILCEPDPKATRIFRPSLTPFPFVFDSVLLFSLPFLLFRSQLGKAGFPFSVVDRPSLPHALWIGPPSRRGFLLPLLLCNDARESVDPFLPCLGSSLALYHITFFFCG